MIFIRQINKAYHISAAYHIDSSLTKDFIEKQTIYCSQYDIYGHWKFKNNHCMIIFSYNGKTIELPFDVPFTAKEILWTAEMAAMEIEIYIDDCLFQDVFENLEGDYWDE